MHRTPLLARVVAVFFVLAAIGYVVWYWTQQPIAADASFADFILYLLQGVPSVVALLLPAVILVRHPDAWWTTRTILFGALLYAAVQGMIILANPLQPTFEGLTPADQELPLVTLAEVYRALILLVGVIGLAYIGVGLSIARRYVDVGPRWATAWFVPAATIFGTVVGVLAVQAEFAQISLSPPLVIYVASSVILGVMRIAVWAYLASVATRGWAAREDPRAGWGLASLAGAFVVVALVIVNLTNLIGITDATIGTLLGWLTVITYSGGHLLLLAGFGTGLPEVDDEEAPEFDDEDDELDDFDDVEDAEIEDLVG